MKFCICIPTLNEEKYLPLLLDSLANQTNKDFRIVIADSNSEDKTVTVAESFKSRMPLDIVRTTVRGVSYERNLAAQQSKEDHLLFLDADTIVQPDFIKDLSQAIGKDNLDVATCWNQPLKQNLIDKIIFKIYNTVFLRAAVTGTCIYFKRQVFEAIGGFNVGMKYGEDSEIVKRARKAGYSFGVFKKPIIFFSTRRMDKEGRLKYYSRAIFWGAYTCIIGKVPEKSPIKYEFGKHM